MRDSWLPALVLMWLCAMPALGLPTPKRLPETLALPKHREEVLAGRDFLSVFMRTSSSRSAARQQLGQPAAIGNGGGGSDFSENSNSVQQLHRVEGVEQRYTDINQKGEGVLEATDYAEEFESARNFNSRDRFTEDRHPLDASPTTTPSPGGAPSQAQTVTDAPATTTTETPSTTTPASEPEEEAAVSSFYDLDEENPSEIGIGGLADVARTEPSFASYWARFTEKAPSTPPAATPSADANDQPLQVISVRVSSSVVRHSHKVDDHSTPKPFESEKLIKTASRLVTQEQPTLTAVQRSSLNVEEGPLIEGQNYAPYRPALPIAPAAQHPPSPETQSQVIPMQTSTTVPPPQTSVPPNLHNLGSSFGVRNLQKPASQTNGFSEHQPSDGVQHNSAHQSSADYHNSPEALAAVQEEINVQRTDFLKLKETKPENHTHKVNRYDLENKPRSDDDDGVNKYNVKDYGLFSKQDEKEKQVGDGVRSYDNEPKALAYHYDPQNPQLSPVSYQTSVSSATSGSRVRFYSEPLGYRKASQRQTLEQQRAAAPAGYEQPERVYGVPEQNYEVDEAVSVVTNGRTHGVQGPAPAPPSPPPSVRQGPGDSEDPNKSGYVLEGRNFRKYRVEEKTADGFIVGEYGVVSHDDGSLRGVRYTADSTINPRLIYDALVKFLSLK